MQGIREKLKEIIGQRFGIDFEPEIMIAPDNTGADFSSTAPLRLAKVLHKSPMEIGTELSEAYGPGVAVAAPGFLNFIMPEDYYSKELNKLNENFEEYMTEREFEGKTVICEFSDPNPFKVLHVGHLYTSVVGDSIAKLFEYAGARVIRANFGGDVGLHVAKTMYVLRQKNLEELKIEDIAKCYIEGTAAYEEDIKAHEEITKLNKEIYKINTEKIHGTELSDLYWRARELSYEYFEDFYARIGVKFDKYYPESTVAGLGLQKVQEQLANGVYKESDGAVVFDGDKYGLHTRVFINREGVPTYEAKDVGLIFTKWEDYHFDKSVVITGSEQLDYMKVVLKSVEQYAPELVERTTHLTHGLVKLPGGVKMSSRKGNFLKAIDVLKMVSDALKTEYASEDEKVALAATKYAFLKYKMGGDIIFDPQESVKMTGSSGPYLLYSCVRAKKILKNCKDKTGAEKTRYEDDEKRLVKKLLDYKDTLKEAVHEMAPHKVVGYLYGLSQEFSRFYEKCPVVGSEREAERKQIMQAYLNVMSHGLGLLGIEVPEEM